MEFSRRQFMGLLSASSAYYLACNMERPSKRPNFLLLMSDNHSWNHVGCYGDPIVKTPNIDKIAEHGVKFNHAFCASPSCTPARAGMLTGQDIWRLEEGANLWGILPNKFPLYTDLLERAGYLVGSQGKGWGPGSVEDSGREFNHGGRKHESFKEFLQTNSDNKPWHYWFSSRNPHRPYEVGSGEASGMDKTKVKVPSYLPDSDDFRGDMCDYYFEVQKFDKEVGEILNSLKKSGQWDNTVIVICSDNGWQMPRGLANMYDFGTRIPMIFSWTNRIPQNKTLDDFINLNDLAPTFLELAGLEIPYQMTAISFTDILLNDKTANPDITRKSVVLGRERHALCRQGGLGYPARAVRTKDFLYIKNYQPERWPGGDPPLFGDVDAHMLHYPCPTKLHVLANRNHPTERIYFDKAFGKRPAEELYDLKNDPDQMNNVAENSDYAPIKDILINYLKEYLVNTKDPREVGTEKKWFKGKYYAIKDFNPKPSEKARKLLGLKKEYFYKMDD
jgi:N-sulfoglucosamine sulfohydrolase